MTFLDVLINKKKKIDSKAKENAIKTTFGSIETSYILNAKL